MPRPDDVALHALALELGLPMGETVTDLEDGYEQGHDEMVVPDGAD
jgi:hypothetical protein